MIQHHPARAELLSTFENLDPVVVSDPEPYAKVKIAWRTYHACLSVSLPGATWRVVLQDDVELCPSFGEVVERALQHADRPVSLFVPNTLREGSINLLRACARDEAWCDLRPRDWVPAVAVAWPEALVPDFLAWAELRKFHPNVNRADDAIIGKYARERNLAFLATVPSLVEHPDVEPSILRNHRSKGGRRATCFADESVVDIDWSR